MPSYKKGDITQGMIILEVYTDANGDVLAYQGVDLTFLKENKESINKDTTDKQGYARHKQMLKDKGLL